MLRAESYVEKHPDPKRFPHLLAQCQLSLVSPWSNGSSASGLLGFDSLMRTRKIRLADRFEA